MGQDATFASHWAQSLTRRPGLTASHYIALGATLTHTRTSHMHPSTHQFMAMFDTDENGTIDREEFRVYARLQVIVVYLHNQERLEREERELAKEQGEKGVH